MKKAFIASVVLYVVCFHAKAEIPILERISVSSEGAQANAASYGSALSADARYVVFSSAASNLVTADHNEAVDIFVRDRQTGTTERISVNAAGQEANAASGIDIYLSEADGNYVSSEVLICVQSEPNVEPICPDRGHHGKARVDSLDVSADGRFVVFSSRASNLVFGDTNQKQDIFVFDRQQRSIERISIGQNLAEANGRSFRPSMSKDGRFVAYLSAANNLVADDSNGDVDVFVNDRETGQTERINLDSDGQQTDATTVAARISDNGRFVVFSSKTVNWAPTALLGYRRNTHVFVRDRLTGKTQALDNQRLEFFSDLITPDVSSDGYKVVFMGAPFQYLGPCTERGNYAYLQDSRTHVAVALEEDLYNFYSTAIAGCYYSVQPPTYFTIEPGMRVENFVDPLENIMLSGDERYVVYNRGGHVTRYDTQTGLAEPGSYDSANPPQDWPARDYLGGISDSGRLVSFTTDSEQRTAADSNGVTDIVLMDLGSANDQTPTPISESASPTKADVSVEYYQHELIDNDPRYLNLALKVANKGGVELRHLKLKAKTPAGFKLLATETNSGSCISGKHILCAIDALPTGAEAILNVQMLVKKRFGKTTFIASANSATPEPKKNKKNNTAKLKITLVKAATE